MNKIPNLMTSVRLNSKCTHCIDHNHPRRGYVIDNTTRVFTADSRTKVLFFRSLDGNWECLVPTICLEEIDSGKR